MTRPVVAVDLGDTTVSAAADVAGPGAPEGAPIAPEPVDLATDLAAVFAPTDGDALVTGYEARRRAAADPSRYEPTPRRRADDGELLLGTRTVGVAEAWGAVVSDAVARGGPLLRGGRPRSLVLTHPVGWDAGRVELLRRAGSGLADELLLLLEPVAAASYAAWMRPRWGGSDTTSVAVLDVGATGAAASVVVPARGEVLAHRAAHGFGGADADELLLAHLLADPETGGRARDRVREVAAGATLADRRHRQVLLDDVRAAKERLSDVEQAEVPMPGGGTDAWLARSEVEEVLARAWRRVVGLLSDAVADAGTTPERLDAVWLTGGAARTPQLATLVHRELGVPATVAPDPGLVVARGALVAAREITHEGSPSGGSRPTGSRPTGSRSGGVGRAGTARPEAAPEQLRHPEHPEHPEPVRERVGPIRVPPAAATGPPPRGAAPDPPGAGPPSPTGPRGGPAAGVYDPMDPFGPDDPLGWDGFGPDGASSGGQTASGGPGPAAAPHGSGQPGTGQPGTSRPGTGQHGSGPPRTGEHGQGAWEPGRGVAGYLPDPDPDADTVRVPPGTAGGWSGGFGPPLASPDDPFAPLPGSRTPARRRRRRLVVATVVVVLLVAAGTTAVLVRGGLGHGSDGASEVTAYAHRFVIPAGWVRAGGDDAARRTLLRPSDAPRGADLVAVQDNPVDGTDPAQVRDQLRAQFDAARAAGSPVADLQLDASAGGRDVARYRQVPAPGAEVDWIVVLTPGSQVSVGCRHLAAGADATGRPGQDTAAGRVRAACEQVVASVGPAGS